MPSAMGFSASAAGGSMYMVGGTNGYEDVPLMYEYSPLLDKWLIWDGPARAGHLRAAEIADGKLFVFSGISTPDLYYNDVEYAHIGDIAEVYRHMGDETVNLTGNFARNYTDMEYKAPGFSVVFGRAYNSQDERGAEQKNIISKGWTFSFQGSIDVSGNEAVVRLPNGGGYIFAQNTATGLYTARDSRAKLEKDGTSHIMTTPDQYSYVFDSSGHMSSMSDPYGNAVDITVDADGKVSEVTDQAGRVSSIAYSSGRISQITDPAGRMVKYSYDSADRLSKVEGPQGTPQATAMTAPAA
jgi:YD repeat-containing protein